MTSPRVIYFGVSSQKSAAEVGGWSNVDKMGLKDALTYDTTTRKYQSYTKSQIADLTHHLQAADLIVGFNQLQFDYKILSSYTDADLDALQNFDMLSKIEGVLGFHVSRDNLAQSTLSASTDNKGRVTLGKRIDTTKKLFAHGCKEGALFFRNERFGTKGMCDTSNWADIARSITQRKHPLDPIAVPSEPESPQSTPVPQIPSESPKKPPIMVTEAFDKNSIGKQIPEEALRIYCEAKSQHHHCPALYTYKKVASLLDPSISFEQFNVGIGGLWHARNPHERYKNGNFRYYHIDRSSTVAPEWVNDSVDIRNIKEEGTRGI